MNTLIEAKTFLIGYLNKYDCDFDNIEYLIDTLDYFILGKVPCTVENLDIVIEDVLVTSSYHRNSELLQVVSLLREKQEAIGV